MRRLEELIEDKEQLDSDIKQYVETIENTLNYMKHDRFKKVLLQGMNRFDLQNKYVLQYLAAILEKDFDFNNLEGVFPIYYHLLSKEKAEILENKTEEFYEIVIDLITKKWDCGLFGSDSRKSKYDTRYKRMGLVIRSLGDIISNLNPETLDFQNSKITGLIKKGIQEFVFINKMDDFIFLFENINKITNKQLSIINHAIKRCDYAGPLISIIGNLKDIKRIPQKLFNSYHRVIDMCCGNRDIQGDSKDFSDIHSFGNYVGAIMYDLYYLYKEDIRLFDLACNITYRDEAIPDKYYMRQTHQLCQIGKNPNAEDKFFLMKSILENGPHFVMVHNQIMQYFINKELTKQEISNLTQQFSTGNKDIYRIYNKLAEIKLRDERK